MFSHVMLGVNDLEKSRKFYDAVLGTLGIGPGFANKSRYFYRSPTGTFAITTPINGQPATLADLASISALLADLHGQHEHHALLHRATQQRVLDEYGGHLALVEAVRAAHAAWLACRTELEALESGAREREDRRQLLDYQLGELRELALAEGEIEGNLSQEWDFEALAGLAPAAVAEQIHRPPAVGAEEIAHVLDDPEDGDLEGPKHVQGFGGDLDGHLLRGHNDDRSCEGDRLG